MLVEVIAIPWYNFIQSLKIHNMNYATESQILLIALDNGFSKIILHSLKFEVPKKLALCVPVYTAK